MGFSRLLELTALVATAGSLPFAVSILARAPRLGPAPRASVLAHPWTQFVVTCALVLLNQLAVNVYVRALHHGDPSFVARYLGRGWFHVAPDAPIVVLAARAIGPYAGVLSPSILRVQAFFELPLVFWAYLSIARLIDRALYRALVRSPLLPLASVAFTVPFCVVEASLRNPWTDDDLVVRAAACVIVPAWIAWCARGEGDRPAFAAETRATGLVGFVVLAAGALATAWIVLVLYDAALLYNIARLEAYLPSLVVAVAIATLAHIGDGRYDGFVHRLVTGAWGARPPASLSVRIATSALASFTAIFFVPSLALRYAGASPSAWLAGGALVLLGAIAGVILAVRDARPRGAELTACALGAVVALAVAVVAALTDLGGLGPRVARVHGASEALLFQKAGVVLVVGGAVWRVSEAMLGALWRLVTRTERAAVTSPSLRRP